MKLHLFPLSLLVVCLSLTCGALTAQAQHGEHNDTSPTPGPAAPTQAYGSAPTGWNRFSPTENTFSVLLPKNPEENITRTEIAKGSQITTHAYTVTTDGGVYLVAYMSDLPVVAERMSEAYKESFYDGMWKGMAQGIREELEKNGMMFKVEPTGQRKTTVGGIDGREQDFSIGPLQGRAQMALTGQRAFMTMAFWSDEKSATERAAFFSSFQIRGRR